VRKSIVLILKPYAAEESQKRDNRAAALNSSMCRGVLFLGLSAVDIFDEVD
jgi:myo-inositol catabolism protein IolC